MRGLIDKWADGIFWNVDKRTYRTLKKDAVESLKKQVDEALIKFSEDLRERFFGDGYEDE